MKLSNKTYDFLKWMTLIALPAIITFYGVLGQQLNIPNTEVILTIATAFVTMLGTLLGVSNNNFIKESPINHQKGIFIDIDGVEHDLDKLRQSDVDISYYEDINIETGEIIRYYIKCVYPDGTEEKILVSKECQGLIKNILPHDGGKVTS